MTVQAVCPWQTEEVAAWHPQPRLTTWAWYMNVSPQQRPLLCVLLQTLLNVGKQRATSQLYVYSEKTHYILEFNLEVTEEETHTVHSLTHSLGDTLAECLVCRSVGESRHTNVEARPQGWKQSLNLLAVTVQSKLKLGKKEKKKERWAFVFLECTIAPQANKWLLTAFLFTSTAFCQAVMNSSF